jgi:hypothetical protein
MLYREIMAVCYLRPIQKDTYVLYAECVIF